ncbi:hypothetical protein [uncultured Lacinutrix sp.]|uniref:hypothetical protein n=1 Tax=uncultured Lacinutrix sp. TaxID=574032 RepID=UPI00261B987D|nr:hypothetical protein [uncultured Lacinutrix sp.]
MKTISLFTIFLFFILSCNNEIEGTYYENQIGDTAYNPNTDNKDFKFCDSTNVLHKRALIKYNGGEKALEAELLNKFVFNPKFEHFSGYFIVRFAINCKNKTGRYRLQTLDSSFLKTKPPNQLSEHILSIIKSLNGWNHPFYKGKDLDGYSFFTIKIINGEIQKT